MFRPNLFSLGLLSLAFFLSSSIAWSQEKNDPEVLMRGPVHAAFADPVTFNPEPGIIVPKAPPDPIEELPPEQKPEGDVIWIPGYWGWDDDQKDYIWVSGIWRLVPPGYKWVPGYWTQVETGFQWVSGFWAAEQQNDVEYLPPPPQSLENGPSTPQPADNCYWVPGYWTYSAPRTTYLWRTGYWAEYNPNWVWVPPCYRWSPLGYVFVSGYWDYPIYRRGCVFAPVYWSRPVFHPGYYYTPSVIVNTGFLSINLFSRPRYCHYYFGDYYAPYYSNIGFFPGYGFHYRRWGYCADYVYNVHYYRGRGINWHNHTEQHFVALQKDEQSRPPKTYSALIARPYRVDPKVTTWAAAKINDQKNLPKDLSLLAVDKEKREQLRVRARDIQVSQKERGRLETTQPRRPDRPVGGKTAAPVRLNLPEKLVRTEQPGRPSRPTIDGKAKTPGNEKAAPTQLPKLNERKDGTKKGEIPRRPGETGKSAPGKIDTPPVGVRPDSGRPQLPKQPPKAGTPKKDAPKMGDVPRVNPPPKSDGKPTRPTVPVPPTKGGGSKGQTGEIPRSPIPKPPVSGKGASSNTGAPQLPKQGPTVPNRPAGGPGAGPSRPILPPSNPPKNPSPPKQGQKSKQASLIPPSPPAVLASPAPAPARKGDLRGDVLIAPKSPGAKSFSLPPVTSRTDISPSRPARVQLPSEPVRAAAKPTIAPSAPRMSPRPNAQAPPRESRPSVSPRTSYSAPPSRSMQQARPRMEPARSSGASNRPDRPDRRR